MSELPEKKVLKNTLMKLKANVLTATEAYNEEIKRFNELMSYTVKGLQGLETSGVEKQRVGAVVVMLAIIGQHVEQVVKGSLETINDWRTYTEVLENYSAELDNTLTKIFEDAIKQSLEEVEKQKELFKGTPEYTR